MRCINVEMANDLRPSSVATKATDSKIDEEALLVLLLLAQVQSDMNNTSSVPILSQIDSSV